jgi:hypothetical protein
MTNKKKSCAACDAPDELAFDATAMAVGSDQAAQGFAGALRGAGRALAAASPGPALKQSRDLPVSRRGQYALPRVSRLEAPQSRAGCVYLLGQTIATPGGTFKVR